MPRCVCISSNINCPRHFVATFQTKNVEALTCPNSGSLCSPFEVPACGNTIDCRCVPYFLFGVAEAERYFKIGSNTAVKNLFKIASKSKEQDYLKMALEIAT
ncbi:leginsulin related MtN11/16/17 family [Medicago truncatula]|uniref:Leginsulin related MtN11/16/17 family n=1 Tax=Medicago truncatula TaxID=3880 RepID=A0A072UUT1_MEDTR|nr:leginsulin related MtN11/16/17 family [Medicago truncatula]